MYASVSAGSKCCRHGTKMYLLKFYRAKTLKQSLQTSTNFETASGKRQEVKENKIEDSYDITYGDSITFLFLRQKYLIKIKQIILVMKMIRNRMMGRKIQKQM